MSFEQAQAPALHGRGLRFARRRCVGWPHPRRFVPRDYLEVPELWKFSEAEVEWKLAVDWQDAVFSAWAESNTPWRFASGCSVQSTRIRSRTSPSRRREAVQPHSEAERTPPRHRGRSHPLGVARRRETPVLHARSPLGSAVPSARIPVPSWARVAEVSAPPLLFITGIPAVGKSTFTRWLAGSGYERCPSPEEPGPTFFDEIEAALGQSEKVVIDWGFPPGAFPKVAELVSRGFETWWFDGDRAASSEMFDRRQGHDAQRIHYDIYMSQVDVYWDRYQELCGGRYLDVIFPGPELMSNEDRLSAISTAEHPDD